MLAKDFHLIRSSDESTKKFLTNKKVLVNNENIIDRPSDMNLYVCKEVLRKNSFSL